MAKFEIAVNCDDAVHSPTVVNVNHSDALQEKTAKINSRSCCTVTSVKAHAKVKCRFPGDDRAELAKGQEVWGPSTGWVINKKSIPHNTRFA